MKNIICLLLLFSIPSQANHCDLLTVYKEKLRYDSSVETEKTFFQRVIPLMYINEEKLKTYHSEKYMKSNPNSEYSDFEEFLNYRLWDKSRLLTMLPPATDYHQRCDEGLGELRLKVEYYAPPFDINRLIIYFNMVDGRWAFRKIGVANTSYDYDRGFDDNVKYQAIDYPKKKK